MVRAARAAHPALMRIFNRDFERYEGVRPIQIYLLRVLFVLVVLFVGSEAWGVIFSHRGAWNHTLAAAWCMWASYATLSILGIVRPLKMLPIVLFEILYKIVWLLVVAYPLWSADKLAGSPAEAMTYAFLWVILPIVATPWRYVLDTYVLNRRAS